MKSALKWGVCGFGWLMGGLGILIILGDLPPEGWFSARRVKVIMVIDGDTVILENFERVRLRSCDAAERDVPGGFEATQALRRFAEGKWATLVSERWHKDVFGRTVADLEVEDRDACTELLTQGLVTMRPPNWR